MNGLKVTLALTAVLAVLVPAALAARVAPLTSATLGGGTPKPTEVVNQIKLVTSDEAASTTAEAGAAAATTDGELDAELLGVKPEFDAFLARFEKKHAYGAPGEYAKRLRVFARNLKLAAERQADDRGSAVHGVTRFSDLTPEEFASEFLGMAITTEQIARRKAHPSANHLEELPTEGLPASFDWREKGAVTPVKNQGQCGSCWSFSTTGAVEGANFLKSGKLTSLSEQQLVDCDHECDPDEPEACDAGCNGGLPANAMDYIMKAGGLDAEKAYPYKAVKGKCLAKTKGPPASTISNFSYVSVNETQIAAALIEKGPLSIGIDARWMQSYVGGVACPWLCNKERLDHGVLIVGYGAEGFAPVRLHREPYWIIKNSWGPGWGKDGFYQICKDKGSCGLNNMVVAADA